MLEAQSGGRVQGELLLIIGVVIEYIGTRAALSALARPDGTAPGRRALAQWLPIMSTGLAAALMRQSEIAVGLIFGSSVACLSLVLGMTGYVGPMRQLPDDRRLWPLVLPPSLLVLLAGFHGAFTWFHALMLLVMGVAFVPLWTERAHGDLAPAVAVVTDAGAARRARRRPWTVALLALVPAGLGAWAGVRGTTISSEHARLLSAGLLAATVLSPLLVLPSLGSTTMLAQQGQTGRAVTALAGTVLLNLCALLPAVILIHYLWSIGSAPRATAALGEGFNAPAAGPAPFPLVTWRVDAVVLVVLGFALLPLASGRWLPERLEALLLVLLYAAYLITETLVAARLIG